MSWTVVLVTCWISTPIREDTMNQNDQSSLQWWFADYVVTMKQRMIERMRWYERLSKGTMKWSELQQVFVLMSSEYWFSNHWAYTMQFIIFLIGFLATRVTSYSSADVNTGWVSWYSEANYQGTTYPTSFARESCGIIPNSNAIGDQGSSWKVRHLILRRRRWPL